jgi:hypothetical protein
MANMARREYAGRAHMIYFKSERDRESWTEAAKNAGEPVSKYIIEMAKLGKARRDSPKGDHLEMVRLREEIVKLRSRNKDLEALSSLMGLRGGNLLFHLQKLMDSKMILQRNERGDYMITEKGYKTLRGIFETYLHLESQEIIVETTKSLQVLNA